MADFDEDAREEGKCGYICDELDSPCGHAEGWGYENSTSGFCKPHGERGGQEDNQNAVGNDGGPPANNGNAETHGLSADADKWFERHRDDVEDDVKQMVDAWMQLSNFGWEVTGNVKMLTNAAINECQIEQGDRYIRDEGVIIQEPVSAGESVIMKDAENSAFLLKDRLQRTTLQILDKFDILDSPASRQADAQEDIADAWREALSE